MATILAHVVLLWLAAISALITSGAALIQDANYGYQGCFRDVPERKLRTLLALDRTGMTVEKCNSLANTANLRFFGIEVGEECWGGSAADFANMTLATNCYQGCTGNGAQECGGPWALSVYDYSLGYSFQGCVNDETKFGSARKYFGNVAPIQYVTSAQKAVSDKATYFAVARKQYDGYGFTFNTFTNTGLLPSNTVGCQPNCDQRPKHTCGSGDFYQGAPYGRVWAVYKKGIFPTGTLQKLRSTFGLSELQINNILGMIAAAEQSRKEWWLSCADCSDVASNNNIPIWAYAEKLAYDGSVRGVTIGLYGATSNQDAQLIWDKYYGSTPHTPVSTWTDDAIVQDVKAKSTEDKWQQAMFDAYIETYWIPTLNKLRATVPNYKSALTFGAVLDTAMNAGLESEGDAWGANPLVDFAKAQATAPTEKAFLTAFLNARSAHPTADSGDMASRIGAWKQMVADDKSWDMSQPGLLNTYAPLAYPKF